MRHHAGTAHFPDPGHIIGYYEGNYQCIIMRVQHTFSILLSEGYYHWVADRPLQFWSSV